MLSASVWKGASGRGGREFLQTEEELCSSSPHTTEIRGTAHKPSGIDGEPASLGVLKNQTTFKG